MHCESKATPIKMLIWILEEEMSKFVPLSSERVKLAK
jgi:hypothetical protein